jgi:hypothetical protein
MTATFQTSAFNSYANKSVHTSSNATHLYQVDVENFDREVETFEIEAATVSEAARIAEGLFGASVYNMNIYEAL